MAERLQKIISEAGVCSRRAAEKLIRDGRVCVNGRVSVIGQSADPKRDKITVDGIPLEPGRSKLYIMLNKPRGYVTTASDEKGRKTVMELVADAGARIYPVGRLDMHSEGLLIMTNDGEFANRLMHPSHNIRKTYLTSVSGGDIDRAAAVLRGGMVIDGYRLREAEVEIKKRGAKISELLITVREGRNRQVRKMCAVAGLRVHGLRRVNIGTLELGGLPPGKWRHLTDDEVAALDEMN